MYVQTLIPKQAVMKKKFFLHHLSDGYGVNRLLIELYRSSDCEQLEWAGSPVFY